MISDSNHGRTSARNLARPGRLTALLAVAGAAALAMLASISTAQARWSVLDPDGVNEAHRSYDAEGSGRQARAASNRGRSKASRAVSSDDEVVRKPRATRARVARQKSDDDGDSGGYSAKPKVGGGHVAWVASGSCLPGQLRSVIADVSEYGRVVVSSTGRGHSHNASVGGAKGSYHLSCQAADFRVHGNVASAASFLRNHGSVGGFHHYGGGLFHIDTGPKRTW